MRGVIRVAFLLAAALTFVGSSNSTCTLTFEDRVRAQEAIERVYYSHQIGTTKPFEDAISREVLERKVRTYLKQTVALQEFWKTPITADALQRELERIATGTRFPERLQEIYRALKDDSFVIQETLARATLVDRMSRSLLTFDARLQGDAKAKATELRAHFLNGDIDQFMEMPGRTLVEARRVTGAHRRAPSSQQLPTEGTQISKSSVLEMEPLDYNAWREKAPTVVGEPSLVVEDRDAFVVRIVLADEGNEARTAIYQVPKIGWDGWWAGAQGQFDEGHASIVAVPLSRLPSPAATNATSCQPENEWQNGILGAIPEPRELHTAVWTGKEMIIWGGESESFVLQTGERYDPLTDTWKPTSLINAPAARATYTAVWSGSEMIVWGGYVASSRLILNTGGRYDPVADTWTQTSLTGAPTARFGHTAVWTGKEMIIWGGAGNPVNASGVRYDPANDKWTPTSALGAPSPRSGHTAVWTGKEMIVWGGFEQTGTGTGGRYDPASDSWAPVSLPGAPTARIDHTAVWTGSLMIVWGGHTIGISDPESRGGRYNPTTNSWLQTNPFRAPEPRYGHTAVMVKGLMIVWGGADIFLLNSGARYDPLSDSWEPTSTVNAPSPRYRHATVSTGSLMLIWGGSQPEVNTGGRYDPISDSWTPTSRLGTPTARESHAGIWTGNQMVVWGGAANGTYLGDGGRYDPLTDSWTGVTTLGAPMPRVAPAAVWTGESMVVWSGYNGTFLTDGGRYDPVSDEWIGMSSAGAPTGRFVSAVWTGEFMVTWGGTDLTTAFNTGGRYDPHIDVWLPVSTIGAPSPRTRYSMIWTGTEMVVWGGRPEGFGAFPVNTGGRYNPITDTWQSTATSGAPSIRSEHTAIWTGTTMIVWGGRGLAFYGDGARYDTLTNTWSPVSDTNSPSARMQHSSVWTGDLMIVWGGWAPNGFSSDGGRYDPQSDLWSSTSTTDEPQSRTGHTALWTGTHMIVWGGQRGGSVDSGGRYAAAFPPDGDGDGIRACDGDCDDTNPSIHPGAPEICNARDDDCDGTTDQGFSLGEPCSVGQGTCRAEGGTVCDAVGKGTICDALPGAPIAEVCDNLDNDCDGVTDSGNPGGGAACGSNVGTCRQGVTTCTAGALICAGNVGPIPEVCDGLDNNCDGVVPASEADADGDEFRVCQGDCNDDDSSIHPDAVELPGNAADENCDAVLTCNPSAFYKTHGDFVRCVARDCAQIVTAGLVSQAQCDAIISLAAQSNVGRRTRRHVPVIPTAP